MFGDYLCLAIGHITTLGQHDCTTKRGGVKTFKLERFTVYNKLIDKYVDRCNIGVLVVSRIKDSEIKKLSTTRQEFGSALKSVCRNVKSGKVNRK